MITCNHNSLDLSFGIWSVHPAQWTEGGGSLTKAHKAEIEVGKVMESIK